MFKYAQTNIQLYRQFQSSGYPRQGLKQIQAGHDILSSLFSGQYRGNGKPFVCHLVGTASILLAYKAPIPVVLAGLLHAVYAEGNFGSISPVITARKRRLIRTAIGEEAEALIEQYTTFRWNEDVASQLVEKIDRMEEGERAVIMIRIANELEEAITGDILFEPEERRSAKAMCLSYCGQLAKALNQSEISEEIEDVIGRMDENSIPEELMTQDAGSYLRPPLSHRARIGWAIRKAVLRLSKGLYHRSPRWLRKRIRDLLQRP